MSEHPERWQKIEGFEHFEVSNLGRVRSRGTGKELSTHQGRNGAPVVGLRDENGKTTTRFVSGLAARAFLGAPPSPTAVVTHLNGDKTDNRASNLRWVERRDYDGWRHVRYGAANNKSRLNEQAVREIRRAFAEGASYAALSRKYGVADTTVRKVVARETWAHVKETACE